jgi:hypothetical protein
MDDQLLYGLVRHLQLGLGCVWLGLSQGTVAGCTGERSADHVKVIRIIALTHALALEHLLICY